MWVLIALEVSSRLRQLMRYLVNESARVHADVGLLEMLVYGRRETRDAMIHELAPGAKLFRYRLVEEVGSARLQHDAPFLLRALRVASRLVELVHGVVRLDRELAELAVLRDVLSPHVALVLPDALKAQVSALMRNANDAGVATPMLVLVGPEGAGRKALLHGAARQLGVSVLELRCARMPTEPGELQRVLRSVLREAVLFHAVPLFEGIEALAGAEATLDRELAGFVGPLCATSGRGEARPIALARGLVVVDVPMPTESARVELWRRAIATPGVDLERAAARYPITGGLILRAADAAQAHARGRGPEEPVTADDLHAGVRATLDSKLSTLGVRLTWRQTWSDLVLPEDSLQEVREFVSRVRHRRQVYEDWGFGRKVAKGMGLSALFSGPPGTGKTMVAGIIADELALDLYQIDLSRIVSKYVGETEKNLAGVFDAAEAGHAILLFDEADSLFARRTEVKSSVDRYANLEVNYLLQRMESFTGITMLTTNLDASIDEAFMRRISLRVMFSLPEADDREKLWKTMLPREAQVEDDIDFKNLAKRYEFSGGYIRNAVVRAAFFAAEDGGRIGMRHLQRGAVLEYAAMGKLTSGAHG